MNFKKICILSFLSILIFIFFKWDKAPILSSQTDCAFCKQSVLDQQKFYEDDLVIALFNYKPALKGHSLIIPKRHVQSFEELTDEEALRITQIIKKVHKASKIVFGTSSYLLYQKNGKQVGQTVPHVHVHYVPRKENNTSLSLLLFKIATMSFQKQIPSSEMEELTQKMESTIND